MAAISVATATVAALEVASAQVENAWKKSRARTQASFHVYAHETCKLRRLIAASNNKVAQFHNKRHLFLLFYGKKISNSKLMMSYRVATLGIQ